MYVYIIHTSKNFGREYVTYILGGPELHTYICRLELIKKQSLVEQVFSRAWGNVRNESAKSSEGHVLCGFYRRDFYVTYRRVVNSVDRFLEFFLYNMA